ncbi:hypothetical protein EVAR_97638_1 [Eumeta japonica]|uniref:Uncharacterized protein n=1 Tax=Eumeta variegata TaxID=151549 RepID=A0A4C2ACC2_EUMVA|nr:hypothetical protein EVAR_97638_1 [Eumeta japonica]
MKLYLWQPTTVKMVFPLQPDDDQPRELRTLLQQVDSSSAIAMSGIDANLGPALTIDVIDNRFPIFVGIYAFSLLKVVETCRQLEAA